MSFLKKLNGFSNPITGARRACGTCILLIGIIMCIPSIAGYIWANNIYEKSNVFDETASFNPIEVDSNVSIAVAGIMTQGNNYDIKISCSLVGPYTEVKDGQISIQGQATGISWNGALSRSGFNETSSTNSFKIEMEDDFTSNIDSTFTFTINSVNNVSSATVRVRVYENPNRFLVNTINKVSTFLIIPGIIVICCGCCIAPPKRKN